MFMCVHACVFLRVFIVLQQKGYVRLPVLICCCWVFPIQWAGPGQAGLSSSSPKSILSSSSPSPPVTTRSTTTTTTTTTIICVVVVGHNSWYHDVIIIFCRQCWLAKSSLVPSSFAELWTQRWEALRQCHWVTVGVEPVLAAPEAPRTEDWQKIKLNSTNSLWVSAYVVAAMWLPERRAKSSRSKTENALSQTVTTSLTHLHADRLNLTRLNLTRTCRLSLWESVAAAK